MIDNKLIDRRQFIQVAATVIGAASLCQIPGNAHASDPANRRFTVGYVNGPSLVLARDCPTKDWSQSAKSIKLTISGGGSNADEIRALDVLYPHITSEGLQWRTHFAWTNNDHQPSKVVVNVPLVDDGIRIKIHCTDASSICHFSIDKRSGDTVLNTGTYVIVPGHITLAMHHFESLQEDKNSGRLLDRTLAGFKPTKLEHVTLRVENA